MSPETLLRVAAVVVPAGLGALLLDFLCAARGLLPPTASGEATAR